MGKKGVTTAVCLVTALAGVALPLDGTAQWTPQYELDYLHDSNLSRAQHLEDRVSDSALLARATLRRIYAASDAADVSIALDGALTGYAHSDGASFAAIGTSAGWRRKLGLGLTAPWVALDAAVAYENAREPVRDGTRYAISGTAGKRFTRELEGSAGVAYDRRVQREDFAVVPGYGGKPFSVQGRSVFARANYALGQPATLIGAVALREGDVVSSTRRNPEIFTASNAIAVDPAFGPDFIAYRLSGARTRTLTGGLSWELSRRSVLDATLTRDDTSVAGGLDYGAVIFAVTFVHRQ